MWNLPATSASSARIERFPGGRGQEADPPEIHAEDRRFAAAEQTGAPQQGAVAAERDQRVEVDRLEGGTSRFQNGSRRGSLYSVIPR